MNTAAALADARGSPWLAGLDPRLKLFWLLWVSSLSVLLESAAGLGGLFVTTLLLSGGIRMRLRGWLVVGGLLAAIAWSTLLSQAIFYEGEPRTVLLTLVAPSNIGGWSFPGIRLYREGAIYGLAQSLRMLAVTLTGLTLCLTTSPERLLAALAHLRVPVSIAFMTVTTMRFLPLLIGEWAMVRQARRLRGYRLSGWSLLSLRGPQALKWELALLAPVLASALRRATALATSVSSRGFDPTAPRTYYPELQYRVSERLAIAALAISGSGVLVAKILEWTS
jgi:energy-coupling factor transport system permease protein